MPVVKYANAYLTDRMYGGPEEGGWYYDVGEPVMSLPFYCYDTVSVDENGEAFVSYYDNATRNLACDQVYDLCVMAGVDVPLKEYLKDWQIDGFMVTIEDKPGEHFPKKRPHWDMGEDY